MAAVRVAKQSFTLMVAASLVSGTLAIALEMILMRLATRYMGSASDGTTAALTLYLLGLLAGAALVLKLNESGPGRGYTRYLPLLALLAVAAVSAGLGFLSTLPTPALPLVNIYNGLPLSGLVIFIPALLVGTIFPVLLTLCARFYFGSEESYRQSSEAGMAGGTSPGQVLLLYLVSNLGSALGAVASAVWLMPRLGISNALYFTCAGWLAVLLLLTPLLLQLKPQADQAPLAVPNPNKATDLDQATDVELAEAIVSTSRPYTYAGVFIASLAALLFECLSIRLLALICGASFVTTTSAITATLLGIALGTRFSLLFPSSKNTRLVITAALAISALGLASTIVMVPHLANVFQALRQLTYEGAAEADRHARWLAYLYPRLITALVFCVPAATALSFVFPLAARGASRSADMLKLYIAGGAGSALAPILLVTLLSNSQLLATTSVLEFSLRILTVLLAALSVIGLAGCLRGKKATEAILTKAICAGAITLALLVVLGLRPVTAGKLDLGLSFVSPKATIKSIVADDQLSRRIFYREGRSATVSVLVNDSTNTMVLRSDGKVEGTTPLDYDKPAPATDLPTQELLALLPIVWRDAATDGPPTNCFIIGYGTGTTAATILSAAPSIKLQVAEIEPALLEGAANFRRNAAIVPRQAVTTGDARHILAQSKEQFDLIISQPAEPWVQGSTNLYSQEFYQLVKSRLRKNGSYCQWLQLYGMDRQGLVSALKTIQLVFPDCLIYHPRGAGEILVLAFERDGTSALDAATRQKNMDETKTISILKELGLGDPGEVDKRVLLRGDRLRQALKKWQEIEPGAGLISDDNMALEQDTLPEIESAEKSIRTNLELLQNAADKN
ncbi:MAG: fused MFS/spermidine synthase [Cyanobacteria bacterium SZAS TMP-1]|nr:fused MFS/spermidine synthase [Cyanobacteria bacterium SZAS TMP-1]